MDSGFVNTVTKALHAAIESAGRGNPLRAEINGQDIPKDMTIPEGALVLTVDSIPVIRNDQTSPGFINLCWE